MHKSTLRSSASSVDQRYRISWTIDIEAPTPFAAALEAKRIQQDPASIAHVFDITDDRGRRLRIDLDEGRDGG